MKTGQAELMTVLDREHAEAVVEYRRHTIKFPLTSYGAKRLAKQLGKWPDPNEAADMMIDNCWRGFKPEWVKPSKQDKHLSEYERWMNGPEQRTSHPADGQIVSPDYTDGRSIVDLRRIPTGRH